MTNQVSHAKLAECQAKIDALPPEQRALLTPLVEETKQRHYTLNKGFARLRDTVDDWRLAAVVRCVRGS